jgi:hypothetical protein
MTIQRVKLGFTLHRLHRPHWFALFAIMSVFNVPGLRAQQCTTQACSYCSVMASAAIAACGLQADPVCAENAYQQAQDCFAATNALPPDPPTPPPPPTNTPNACPVIFSETRPDSGPQPRLAARPEDESQATQCLKVELLDPVPDLVNNAGNAILVDSPSLSTGGTAVSGVAADGAARLVIRITGGFDGESLTLSIRPDDPTNVPNANNLPHPIGSLATVDGGTVSDSSLAVTLKNVCDRRSFWYMGSGPGRARGIISPLSLMASQLEEAARNHRRSKVSSSKRQTIPNVSQD